MNDYHAKRGRHIWGVPGDHKGFPGDHIPQPLVAQQGCISLFTYVKAHGISFWKALLCVGTQLSSVVATPRGRSCLEMFLVDGRQSHCVLALFLEVTVYLPLLNIL